MDQQASASAYTSDRPPLSSGAIQIAPYLLLAILAVGLSIADATQPRNSIKMSSVLPLGVEGETQDVSHQGAGTISGWKLYLRLYYGNQ